MAKPILPTMALLALSAFGFYSILGLTERNGWGDAIRASVEEGILPNGEPLRTHYTGVAGLDSFLTILVRFFYSCAAGERPGLSLFTVYFAAQVVPAHAILVLEGLRAGNKSTALSFPAIWGLAYQCVPFGVTLPIYCIVHLWRSPLARSQSASGRSNLGLFSMDSVKLSTVPKAMAFGFVLPTILPSLPASLISTHTRQGFLALWQIFPLIISIAHRALVFVRRALGTSPQSHSGNNTASIESARSVYKQLLCLAADVHLATIALVTVPQLQHALGWSAAAPFDIGAVFRPMSAFAPHQVEDLAEGSQTLLLYDMYCGCAAAAVWALSLSYVASGSRVSAVVWTARKLMLRSLLVGPGGAVLWAFWDRDEEMLARTETAKKTE